MGIQEHVLKINASEERYGALEEYRADPEPIGIGGFSKIYRVFRNGHVFAMKIPLNMELDSDVTVYFDDDDTREYRVEAEAWALVSEKVPSDVVRLIDYNIDPFPWMVMELASCSFKQRMRDNEDALEDFVRLLRSLERIHQMGVVHRDIKPENILNVRGRWKFTDFGLSKIMNSLSKTTSGFKGTPQYMSPEQISPKKYGKHDVRTDIWQMGIMLYETLMGKMPYPTKDPTELSMLIIVDGPDYLDAPQKYQPILSKALAMEKDNRFQTAEEFAVALEYILGGDVEELPDDEEQVQLEPLRGENLEYAMKKYSESMHLISKKEMLDEALKLLIESAESGYVKAQSYLGYVYCMGELVPTDGKKSAQWYALAAEQGDVTSQYNLGLIYSQGLIIDRNLGLARKWLSEASKNGCKKANKPLKMIEKLRI